MLYTIFIIVIIALINNTVISFDCKHFDSNMGANFDLSDLVRNPDDPVYSVIDGDLPCTTQIEQNFTYIFNICGAVSATLPSQCKNLEGAGSGGAFQINTRGTYDPNDDYCYLVGKYSDSSSKVELLDSGDPTKGMALTYYGAYCDDGTQRQFRMELMCSDKLSPVPTHALEYEHCVYTITIPSVYGCPLECPVANRELCGGNGHCSYDDDKSAARCFCNKGYKGKDCTEKESDSSSSSLNYSPALLGLIITLFVIVCLLVGGLFYMVRQLQAYKEDMANYQVLKGIDEESMHGGSGVVV